MDDNEELYDPYREPPKPPRVDDNEALNEILENVKSINKRVGLFYWVTIIGLVIVVATTLARLLKLVFA